MPYSFSHFRIFFSFVFLLLMVASACIAQNLNQLLDSAKANIFLNPANTISFATAARKLAIQQKNEHKVATASLYLGQGNFLSGNYDVALELYLETEKMFRKVHDTAGLCKVLNELTILYSKQKKFSYANEVSLRSLVLGKQTNNIDMLGNASDNRGMMFMRMAETDSAELYFRQALAYRQEIKDSIGLSYSLEYLSSVLSEKEQFTEARKLLETSLAIRQKKGDKLGEAMVVNNIGELLLQQNKPDEAIVQFAAARQLSRELQFKDLTANTYTMEAEAHHKLRNDAAAYTALQSYVSIHDELLNEKRTAAMEELQTRYDTEKKEQQNKLLSEENKIKSLQIAQRNIALLATLILIVLAGFTSYLIYNRNRLRREAIRQQEHLEEQAARMAAVMEAEETERQRLARELHDGVGQILAATRRSLQYVTAADSQPLDLLDESIREVRQLSHTMMPPSIRNKNLIEALTDLAVRTRQTSKLKVETQWCDADNLKLQPSQTLMLYRAIQEIISNTLRHAAATSLHLEVVNHGTDVNIMIYDDGKGFDKNQSSAGLGLRNIQSRIQFIGGTLELDAQPGRGVTYNIDIPILHSEMAS